MDDCENPMVYIYFLCSTYYYFGYHVHPMTETSQVISTSTRRTSRSDRPSWINGISPLFVYIYIVTFYRLQTMGLHGKKWDIPLTYGLNYMGLYGLSIGYKACTKWL